MLTLLLCAYLAALQLALMTHEPLRADFRRRGLGIGLVAGVVSLVALVLVVGDAPRLWLALISLRAGPVLLAGVLLAPASAGALWRRRYHLARALGVGEVVFLLFAWALAQWPYIIYPDVSLHATAAPPPTLTFLVATLPLGMGLVLPSLWLLFRVFRRHPPHAGRHGAPGVALAPGAEQS